MSSQYLNLLLVEDNSDDAHLVQETLSRATLKRSGISFKVDRVCHLQQAGEKLAEDSFDLILLDLSLPDRQSLDTLPYMLNLATGIPIVVLCDRAGEAMAFAAIKAGAQDYLVKEHINEYSLPRTILLAVERQQIEIETRQRNREFALLNQVIAASVTQSEPEFILDTACRELSLAFNMSRAVAILLKPDKATLEIVAEFRPDDLPSLLHETLSLADTPLFQLLKAQKSPVVAGDAQHDPRFESIYPLLHLRKTVSVLLLPLIVDDEFVGAISLGTTKPLQFSPQDVNLAWSIADQVAGVLVRARLNQERQLLNAAIEQTAECVLVTDTAGTIIYVNSAFEKVSGYGKHETVGQNLRLLNSDQPESTFFEEMWTIISAGRVWEGQLVNQKKDGSSYTTDTTITPIHDKQGQIVNYVAVQRDVTQELQRQEQYRQAQKMEAVGRLAGGISHDFNNLLTVILGYTEIVMARYCEHNRPLYDTMEQIRHATKRSSALTRQLLAFSRKQMVRPKRLNLNDNVTAVGKMLERLIGADINLRIVPGQDLGYIKADESQLEQVILNLVVNARDAMPQGGQLTIETANVYLDEAYAAQHLDARPGPYVMLVVSDTG
ncbi:MAG: PAS domain S-box protein, partial [Anaerolineae bacterium]|nr:PAS domain S-box protein [Anaerolineae bacterium]